MTSFRVIAAVFSLMLSGLLAAQVPADEALKIEESPGAYILNVPASSVVVSIPRGSLVPAKEPVEGAGKSPRYFHFADDAGLVISGWIESAEAFEGINEFWKGETDAWKRTSAPEPENVRFKDIGDWKVIVYDLALGGIGNTHIRAEYVGHGTWIDVHLSLTSERSSKEAEAALESVLQSFSVNERAQESRTK